MDEQIEKLVNHSGGAGRYQIIILIIGFFVWNSLSLIQTSLPIIERMPKVFYINETTDLTYEICGHNYTVVKKYDYSWITDMGIECDKAKVGYIGTFFYSGMTVGNFCFSIINKYLMHKQIIIIFTFTYVVFLFLTTVINNFYFRLVCLLLVGISQGLANPSTLTIVSESVSSKWRSLFASLINVGYSTCPIMYTYIYVGLGKWKYIFWMQNIIATICGVLYIIILKNSARTFFTKNKPEEGIEVLRKIAKFNGKLNEFEEALNNNDFDSLLKNEENEENKETVKEEKNQLGYSALFKYRSVRYKFIIFSVMWMFMTFLTNAIVINTKKMKGDFYINIISLFIVEILAGVLCGFIINIPSFGRKKSLITFYIGVTVGFGLYILFDKLNVGSVASLIAMGIIRFSCTGVFTSYYIYYMESYPTPIRALGFGLNQTLGNLAGSISPIIIEFFNEIILYISFAAFVIINIILTFFVPETVGKPMLETIEEIEQEKLIEGRESENQILSRGTLASKDEVINEEEKENKKDNV
jgi:OCT family organic cation transporter-like MFS transporter 4/5